MFKLLLSSLSQIFMLEIENPRNLALLILLVHGLRVTEMYVGSQDLRSLMQQTSVFLPSRAHATEARLYVCFTLIDCLSPWGISV